MNTFALAGSHLLRSRVPAHRFSVAWLIFSALVLGGCYSYAPVEFDAVSPPEQVRAHLNQAGASRMNEVLGAPESTIQGQLLAVEPEGVTMTVSSGTLQEGFHFQSMHQEMTVPREQILVLERRRLDPLRTVGVAALGAVIAGFVIREVFEENQDQRAPTPPSGPGELRAPLVWLRLP